MSTNRAAPPTLALILRQVPAVVWATDRDLRFTYVQGQVMLDDLEPKQPLTGTTVYEFVDSRDPTEPAVAHHLAALAGGSQSFEYVRNGRSFEVVVEPLRDAAGAIVGCVGAAIDQTDRLTVRDQTTEKLRQSISLLEATLDATADGILVVNTEGRIVAHNQRFVALWRVPPSLVAEGNDAALLSFVCDQLEEPQDFLNGVRALYASPERESFDVIRFKDGRVFERFSMRQVVADTAVGRVWSFRDVTERERLLFRATFMADATRLLASLDVVKALNAVARLAIPYLGEACAVDLIQNGKLERVAATLSDEEMNGAPELNATTLAGHSTIYTAAARSHMAVPLFCRNAVIGAMTFVAPLGRQYTKTDLELLDELGRRAALSIDNARLYEGARDALHGRDEFLSVTAHEIRGPLTSLHLAVQSLLKGTLTSAPARQALDVIEREGRRLARFVEELLDLGRIRTGQMHFALEEVNLGSVLRDVVSRLSEETTRAGLTVSVTTEGDLTGQWDRFRLEQVLSNVLANAIKYGNGKPIQLKAARSGGAVTVTCVDQGIGIEPAMLSRIFAPFERVAARHYGGLGLGLHISKTIVEGLGGAIAVDSTPGEGSRFALTLPVSRSAAR